MDFSGYDEQGQPMYRSTADGPQCYRCDGMDGEHTETCPNSDDNDPGTRYCRTCGFYHPATDCARWPA